MTDYEALVERMRSWGDELTMSERSELQVLHDAYGFGCAAHSEGQDCCVDHILGDTR